MPANDAAESQASGDPPAKKTAAVPDGTPPGRKPRSKVERAVVWGGILILLAVTTIELKASRAFTEDFTAAQDALDVGPVTESDIKRLITNYSRVESKPDLTANMLVASREDKYSYRGLLKQRVLYVYYGVVLPHETEAEVLAVTPEQTEFFDFKKQQPGEAAESGTPSAAPVAAPIAEPNAAPAAAPGAETTPETGTEASPEPGSASHPDSDAP